MPLLLKWQASDISLYETASGEEFTEDRLLNRVELDFELGPLALTTDEDRHRLLAALVQLRTTAEIEEAQVDLCIPAYWGVTHRVPSPALPEEDLRDHLRWELSRALIDSEDQYRHNFGFEADGGILLVALRLRLLEPIEQVIQESGFQLVGLHLDGEPWNRINLVGPVQEPMPEMEAKAPPRIPEPPAAKKSVPESVGETGRTQHPRFFAIVLVIGLIIIGAFAWWKLTTPKKPGPVPQPITRVQEAAPVKADTTTAAAVPAPQSPVETERPLLWADMSYRMSLLDETLAALENDYQFDLISFTENYFLCQLIAPQEDQLDDAIQRVRNLSGLTDVKTAVAPPLDDLSVGIVSATVATKSPKPTAITPVQSDVVALGKKHGLTNKGLIFTGSKEPVLSFLNDVASQKYAIYRLIIVPWGDEEYRAVLEL